MIRIRSQLMASIYDKSLKRKDFSGTTRKDADVPDAKDKKGIKASEEKANDPKASADVGKIVNMMGKYLLRRLLYTC